MTPEQCRAARGLLGWTQPELAAEANLKLLTIVEFETGQEVIESVIATIRLALIAAGVEFCSEVGCIGIVRLKDIMSVTVPDAIKAELGADNDATE